MNIRSFCISEREQRAHPVFRLKFFDKMWELIVKRISPALRFTSSRHKATRASDRSSVYRSLLLPLVWSPPTPSFQASGGFPYILPYMSNHSERVVQTWTTDMQHNR